MAGKHGHAIGDGYGNTLFAYGSTAAECAQEAARRRVSLRGAVLCADNLSGADLRNADLRNTKLQGADLRNANLRDADLSGADLNGVQLHGCTLPTGDTWEEYLEKVVPGLLGLGIDFNKPSAEHRARAKQYLQFRQAGLIPTPLCCAPPDGAVQA